MEKNPITGEDVMKAYKEAIEIELAKITDPDHQAKIKKRSIALTAGMAMLGFGPTRTNGEALRVIGAALEALIPLLTAAQDQGTPDAGSDGGKKPTVH